MTPGPRLLTILSLSFVAGKSFLVATRFAVIVADYCRVLIVAGSDNQAVARSLAFLGEAGVERFFRSSAPRRR